MNTTSAGRSTALYGPSRAAHCDTHAGARQTSVGPLRPAGQAVPR